SVAVGVIIFVAVAATTTLNTLRFNQLYEYFILRRLDAVIADIRRDIVVGLDLGLPLHGIANLPSILARHADEESGIAGITIHDCADAVVAEAGSYAGGKATVEPAPWRAFVGQA